MKKMMKKKQILTTALTVAVVVGTAFSVLALGNYLTNFNSQYNAQYQTVGSKLDSCNLCHPGGNTGQRNTYATDFAANSHSFTAIESLDSDGDGFTNIEEIAAGTFPGDPNDFPNAPPPNIACVPTEGTLGTEVVCTGSGFGSQKGKVVLGTIFAKIAKGGWTNTTISSAMTKTLLAGPYDVIIYPKSTSPILLPNVFTVMDPEIIEPLLVNNGSPGAEISVTGRFFSTKKGKVSIEGLSKGQPKSKNCKVTYWFMNPTTGESELRFVVPKGLDQGTYPLILTNKVGGTQTTFTVGP